MALSGSNDYTVDRDTMVGDSFSLVGIGVDGETLDPNDSARGVRLLNLFLQELIADADYIHVNKQQAITMVAGQATLTLGPSGADITMPRPHKIYDECFLRDSNGIDIPVTIISESDYNLLPDKTVAGTPNQLYFDGQITSASISLYPVPAAADVAEYTLYINYLKPFDDMDAATNDFEFPPEARLMIMYGLADLLFDHYPGDPKLMTRVGRRAYNLRQSFLDSQVEGTSVYLMPEVSHGNS